MSVEQIVSKLKGVSDVVVNYQTTEMVIDSKKEISVSAINKALSKTSYKVVKGAPANSFDILAYIKKYFPIIAILFSIAAFSLVHEYALRPMPTLMGFMNTYMAAFFLVFASFKLVNIRNFADSFAQYDPIAKRSRVYALSYPFIELVLGIMYATSTAVNLANLTTILVMGIGTIGVVQAINSKKSIKCACLGGFFNLPMSSVTLFENLTMVGMAILMIFLG